MPLLRVFTTLPAATFTDEKIAATSKMFTAAIKKPEQWVCVHFVPDQKMIFAGSTENCAQAEIMSIGNLGDEDNIRITKTVQEFLAENFGIPANRTYIQFKDAPKGEVGWNNTTFGTIL